MSIKTKICKNGKSFDNCSCMLHPNTDKKSCIMAQHLSAPKLTNRDTNRTLCTDTDSQCCHLERTKKHRISTFFNIRSIRNSVQTGSRNPKNSALSDMLTGKYHRFGACAYGL